MKHLARIVLPALLFLSSCGGGDKIKDETKTSDSTTTANTETWEQSASQRNARREQRKSKGDTVSIPHTDLQPYLPEIDGYTKNGTPKGQQVNNPGMGTWSETEQEYVIGDKRITVKIMDYNAAWQTFQGLTAAYGMAFNSEDDTKKQNLVDLGLKDVQAYQTTYKQEEKSELVIVAADRFFITLNADENDEAFLKDVTKKMQLDKLTSL